ncbi:alpha amylase, catalytic region [Candidatus Koribacter versatilis Ellin345]|uniref:Alpha amylase, catalytic region n=1 Tax=Koribacter versatilis (strain Ellin345) TaxID=204669 RepID=Q1IUT9_KORVE|nr:alpha-glucosidase [Candidatus Koribacter versatilis]ABF39361.1 alpha amylase, catalytic region [Candidatus Koribacter versatilis Ellin345]
MIKRLLVLSLFFAFALPVLAQTTDADWWRHAVIYEIYPRSFGDSNGDGLGDLNGITEHLDYLKELGVDGIWISPCFPSPQVDFGYDVSDYTAIAPEYGTMADFDRLMAEAKKRNIRVLLDFVVNHSSDKHPWFIESASSRTNPKADWYVWKDGIGADKKQVPTNWISLFGHSAWEWDSKRNQFYYHMFAKEQPDLNWRNPEVQKAMYGAMRFWMDKGVSGFRLDAVDTLFEDPNLHDDPILPGKKNAYGDQDVEHKYTQDLPETHDVYRAMRHVTNQYPGGVLVGEVYFDTAAQMATIYGKNNDEINLPMATQLGFTNKRDVSEIRRKLDDLMTLPATQTALMVFDNHDNARSWDRYGNGLNDAQRAQFAKVVAATLLTPRGSALMYYGQEIGMKTTTPTRREEVKDPIGRTGWPKEKGRDGERTPMQWSNAKDAGFSSSDHPWLPVPPTFKQVNVAAEDKDPNSVLNFYRAMLKLRRENPVFRDGDYKGVNENNSNVLAFTRTSPQGTVLVVLNYSDKAQTADYSQSGKEARTLLSTFSKSDGAQKLNALTVPAFGVFIGQVQ